MKRTLDVAVALAGLIVCAPLFAMAAALVWLEDRHSPWYRGVRVGRGSAEFRMLKFRTMCPDAWHTGVNSTAADDRRITRTGRWLRRGKLDELPQLWNVLRGDMSLVGPRPQVPVDASLYTTIERGLLAVRPGITDLASIVFSDEGEILTGSADPDLLYNQVIRPWKSRLGLLCVEHSSLALDLRILGLTALRLVSPRRALAGVARILLKWQADALLIRMARRDSELLPHPPPGSPEIVTRYRTTARQGSAA